MTKYNTALKTSVELLVPKVVSAISVLRIVASSPTWSLDDLVKAEISIPITAFMNKIDTLEKCGMVKKVKDKPVVEWTLTSLGAELFRKYEDIERLLIPKR